MSPDGSSGAPAKKPGERVSILNTLPVIAFVYVLAGFMDAHYQNVRKEVPTDL
jgi:hypothetical protein